MACDEVVDGVRPIGLLRLCPDLRWDDDLSKQPGQYVDVADDDQHNERRAVGDDQHQRALLIT